MSIAFAAHVKVNEVHIYASKRSTKTANAFSCQLGAVNYRCVRANIRKCRTLAKLDQFADQSDSTTQK